MYSQNRYQQEEIDRAQAEAEKMYLNKNGEYNGRDYDDRDRRRSSDEYDDRRRSDEYDDRYGHNDRCYDERDRENNNVRHTRNDNDREVRHTHVPVPVPVAHVHVPVPITVTTPISTNIKKYRAAAYDKYDRIFAKQMQNFELPQEFTNFTNGLLKEQEVNRLCLLEAIADYNKMKYSPLPEAFKNAAEHCRKYRAIKYDISDQTYAKQMQFYDLPKEFSEFTENLLKETHINRFNLLEAIDNYNAKSLPELPCVFQDVAFNCRPYQPCVIC